MPETTNLQQAMSRIVALNHALHELVKAADEVTLYEGDESTPRYGVERYHEANSGFGLALERAKEVLAHDPAAPAPEVPVAAVLPALRTLLDDYPLRYVTKAATLAAFNDAALWLEAQERAARSA